MNQPPKKLVLGILLGLSLVGCNDQQDQPSQSNLDAPEVVAKNSTANKTKSNIHLGPLRDGNNSSMLIGYNQSINSFAPMQCFTYTQKPVQLTANSSLGVGYTSEDIQKKLGIDSSVKIKLDTFHVSDKNDITSTSSYASNTIRVYYTAYVGGIIQNQVTGLTSQGGTLFKQGLSEFAAQCGSSFVNSFEGYYYTVFYFDISSTDSKTMHSIKNTAKLKVSFVNLMNTVSSSQSENNSSVQITAGITNYGGTLQDAGKITAATSGLLSSSDLVSCLNTTNSNSHQGCLDFISKDVGQAISTINSVVSDEVNSNDLSGMYPDFSSVTNNITAITGAMIGEKKTKTIPDPYIAYPLLSVANVAQDLSVAATNASALEALVTAAGNLTPTLQFVPSQLANNTKAYTSAAGPIWNNIKTCLANITLCSKGIPSSVSVASALSASPQALEALYAQAYQIILNVVPQGASINSIPASAIPEIMMFNNGNAYLFTPSSPNSNVFVFNGITNITGMNVGLSESGIPGYLINVPNLSGSNFATWNTRNSASLSEILPLNCSLTNLNGSCTAYIFPTIGSSANFPGWLYSTMSTANTFTSFNTTQ